MTHTTTPRRARAASGRSSAEPRSPATTIAYDTKDDLPEAGSRGADKWLWFVEAHQQSA